MPIFLHVELNFSTGAHKLHLKTSYLCNNVLQFQKAISTDQFVISVQRYYLSQS